MNLPNLSTLAYVDPFGNRFSSNEDMCQFHGISYEVYKKRMQTGWSQSTALTTPVEKKHFPKQWKPIKLVHTNASGIEFYLCSNNGREEILTLSDFD